MRDRATDRDWMFRVIAVTGGSVELAYPQGWDVAVDSDDLEGTEAVAEFYRVLDDGTTHGQISVFADGEVGSSLRAKDVLRTLMMEYGAGVAEFEVVMEDDIEVAGAAEVPGRPPGPRRPRRRGGRRTLRASRSSRAATGCACVF